MISRIDCGTELGIMLQRPSIPYPSYRLGSYTFSASNGTQYSFCVTCDKKCQDSNVSNAVKLSVVVKKFIVEGVCVV